MRYSILYRNIKLWQIITYGEDFINFKSYIVLNSEATLTHSLQNTRASYAMSNILTKRLVLPVDRNKNGLVTIYEAAPYVE